MNKKETDKRITEEIERLVGQLLEWRNAFPKVEDKETPIPEYIIDAFEEE